MESPEIVTTVLRLMAQHARPGISTLTLNNLAEKKIKELGGVCYNKGYKPAGHDTRFPTALCISLNNEICHGIPNSAKVLHEGDLVNFDVGVLKNGACADAAFSMGIGEISAEDRRLLKTARKALYAGIEKVRPGVKVRDIANAIEDTARQKGYVVNRTMSGHSIGKKMHEEPFIYHAKNWFYNYPKAYQDYEVYMNIQLVEGQKICLEPMLTRADKFGERAADGWTWITKDGSKSAFFEHMILVTATGYKLLTNHIDNPTNA